MATYNYNNGNYTSGLNYSYGYNNGNYSSQTNVVNGVAYRQNITTIGGGCGGDNNCIDGYSLYFPCIKTITRGQNVCFDFYIGDNENKDEVDMRDLDALTLSLSGVFGCEYNTYTYPEDITSLQSEKYKEILYEDFNTNSNVCELSIEYIGDSGNVEPNVTGKIGLFYRGSEILLVADDTPDDIFVCWGKQHDFEFDEECDETNGVVNYDLVTSDKEYKFTITEDVKLYAIYRSRKKYKVRMSFENRHVHYEVYYNGERHLLTDKIRDYLYVLEGYKFNAIAIPNRSYLDDNEYYYTFKQWNNGNDKQSIELIASDNNDFIDSNGDISLLSYCFEETSKSDLNNGYNDVFSINDFKYNYPDTNELNNVVKFIDFTTNDNIMESKNAKIKFIDNGKNGVLCLNGKDSYIKTNVIDVLEGIKVKAVVYSDSDSIVNFEVNGDVKSYIIDSSDSDNIENTFECIFPNCNYSYLKISVDGSAYIDKIYVYEEEIEDKGKARLCLSSEDTSKMYPGPLFASGAINVNGNIFGINKTQIGNINNLRTINIL